MAKFTEGFADKLRVPEGVRDVQVFDDELPGFGIRKFASGKASYFCKFAVGTQQRRKTLGRAVRGNLRAMRLEASAILAKARLGTDVVAIARADAAKNFATLGEVIPRYLAAREGELRPKTLVDTARYLRRSWAPLHALPVDAITRQQIVGVIDGIERDSGAVSADRARAALSALLAWGIDRGYLGSNATVDIRPRAQNGARERVLTEAELVAVWDACDGADDFSRIVRLLVLTGCRRREIGDLGWSEIDLEKRYIHLPAKRTKNGRTHLVPLSDEAMNVLTAVPCREGRDFLFGNAAGGFADWARSKAKLDARLPKMASWLVHDLRRSFVTRVNERGFGAPHIIEACVNHIGGAKLGIAGRYNHASYLSEKRRTLELWGAHITALATGKASKVVPLRRAQSGGIDAAE